MKNRRKNREVFGEHSYWQSYSDMMAALLLVFVLIIAITLAIYRQKTVDLDQARLDLNAAQTLSLIHISGGLWDLKLFQLL